MWNLLELDHVPGGVSETGNDNVGYDAESGWNHPKRGMGEMALAANLPVDYPLGDDMQ